MNVRTGHAIQIDPKLKYCMASEEIAKTLIAELKQFMPIVREQSEGTRCQFTLSLPDHPSFLGDAGWRRTLAVQVRDVADATFSGVNRIKKAEQIWTLHVSDPQGHKDFESWALEKLGHVMDQGLEGRVDLNLPTLAATSWSVSQNTKLRSWYPQGLADFEAHCLYPEDAQQTFLSEAAAQGPLHDKLTDLVKGGRGWRFDAEGQIHLVRIEDRRQARELEHEGAIVGVDSAQAALPSCCC